MTVFMFPGQGAQSKGMGAGLFERFPDLCNEADDILGYSIESLCLDDSDNRLKNTQYTQPALFTVEALAFLDNHQMGEKADYCIGHSVGEYAALFAANVFDFETGLKLVKKRGELMAQAKNGTMLAVINLPETRINELLHLNGLDNVSIANKNSPQQYVLSGSTESIAAANKILSEEAMMCIPLNVSGAFHSHYMDDAKDEFAEYIDQFSFNQPSLKVVANVNVDYYNADNVKQNLISQINSSVLWLDTIAFLKNLGETEFKELGPGNVLTRLMAQN